MWKQILEILGRAEYSSDGGHTIQNHMAKSDSRQNQATAFYLLASRLYSSVETFCGQAEISSQHAASDNKLGISSSAASEVLR